MNKHINILKQLYKSHVDKYITSPYITESLLIYIIHHDLKYDKING